MSRALRLTVDPSSISVAATIRRAAGISPLLVLTGRDLGDLAAELGSMEAASGSLLQIAEDIGKPIGVNLPTGPDTSSTAFIAPRGWSDERLAGWIAGHHTELEAELGEIVTVGRS